MSNLAAELPVDEARGLLGRAQVLRERADLDLLVFFARHPRVLLASESLARLLGHDLKDIARSLDFLLESGLLKRTQTSAHAARLYVFAADAPHDWLRPLLEMAATRRGRLALRQGLVPRAREALAGRGVSDAGKGGTTGPRPVVRRMNSGAPGERGSEGKTG